MAEEMLWPRNLMVPGSGNFQSPSSTYSKAAMPNPSQEIDSAYLRYPQNDAGGLMVSALVAAQKSSKSGYQLR